ncbi:MAG: hypothetical protein M9958_08585 [Chitinophagales bacterium]|nr:hypothetical protein [Chitinophagales bacterium]
MNKLYTYVILLLTFISSAQAVELVNNTFRATIAPPWVGSSITFETGGGGYQRFTSQTNSTITSPAYDWSGYNNIKVEFQVAKFGSGTDGPISIVVSDDGGSTWTAFSANGATPTSSTYVTSTINLPNTLNRSNLKIRFTRTNSVSEKRFRDLVITGDVSSCTAPSATPEGFHDYSTATTNSIDLEWINGDGAGRVIKMNTSNSFTNLTTGANPTANLTYGSGEQVVYNGTGSSPITITGLLPNTTYYFKGYEYCSPDKVYNNSGVSETMTTDMGAESILTDAVAFGPYCNGTANNISVEFTSTGTFNVPFDVQLSDANGNFSNNLSLDIIGSGTSSPISATIPINTANGTKYRVRVINTDPTTIGTDNGSDFTVLATPTTPTTSSPTAVCQGTSLSVTGSGSSNATGYTFWDAASGGNQITAGVSGNTLTLDNTTPAGTYTYYIQGENGTCISNRKEVTLQINVVPTVSGSYTYSDNPSCGPATIGFDAGYFFQTSAGGTSQANPTSSSYTLNASGTIYVRAFNGDCWSAAVASNAVVVNNPINVSVQPTNKSIPENGSGQMSVTASNVNAYQWQENDGNGWANLSGETNSTLTFNNPPASKDGYTYRVILTATAPCTDVTSSVATLTVTAPLAGSLWSNPITGSSSGITSPYTTGQTVTSPNLTVSGLMLTGAVKTAANDRFNSNTWSSTIDLAKYFSWTLTPQSGYELSLQDLDLHLQSSGSGPDYIEVRTSYDNYGSVVYSATQPQSGNPESHTVSFNYSNIDDPITIRLYARGTAGTFSVNDFDFSGMVTLIPVCSVATPTGTFSYSANPSCGPATISYSPGNYFQTSETGTSTTSPTSAPYNLTSSGTIYVRAYNGTCWSDAVASDPVIISNPIVINKQPQNRTISTTGSGTMSVTASNVQSYQWQENDGNGWNDINGATSSTLTFNNPSQSKSGYTYRVVMTGNSPCTSTSSAATLTVVTPNGPCSSPANLSTNVVGNQVTFNWTGTNGADIHAVLLIDAEGKYSKGFSPTSVGFTATIPSGTYTWVVMSLCNTELFGNGNASQWIQGSSFIVP